MAWTSVPYVQTRCRSKRVGNVQRKWRRRHFWRGQACTTTSVRYSDSVQTVESSTPIKDIEIEVHVIIECADIRLCHFKVGWIFALGEGMLTPACYSVFNYEHPEVT